MDVEDGAEERNILELANHSSSKEGDRYVCMYVCISQMSSIESQR